MTDSQLSSTAHRHVSVWYVMFQPGPVRSWWDHLLDPRFRHVLAFGYVGYCDSWMIVNPGEVFTAAYMIPDSEFPSFIGTHKTIGAQVLKIRVIGDAKYHARLGNWCTQTIARLIGIRSSAWRPEALYRDLLRAGAVHAFEDSHVNQGRGSEGRPRARQAT